MHSIAFFEQFTALGVLALIIIGASSGIRQSRRRKEVEHLERMKAMEMGQAPSPVGLDWPTATVCIAIGAVVPVGSFAVCWLATLTEQAPSGIWVAPVFVSFAAINAARKLAYRLSDPRSKSKRLAYGNSAPCGKPEFDPDAFDVVGSRG